MTGTDPEPLERVALQLAAVARGLDRRSDEAVRRVDAGTAALVEAAQGLTADAERCVDGILQLTRDAVQLAMAQGAGPALAACRQELQAGTQCAREAAEALREERRALVASRRGLLWRVLAAWSLGAALAIGSMLYADWAARRDLGAADFSQEVRQAIDSGALARCGDALCLRAGLKPRHDRDQPTYVLVE